MNADDKDIERYLKLLTLLETEEIEALITEHKQSPESRVGQKRLAYEVVKIIHGEKDANMCEEITEFLFGSTDKLALLQGLSPEEFEAFYNEIGGVEYTDQNLFGLFIES